MPDMQSCRKELGIVETGCWGMMMSIRRPVVSGKFYSSGASELRAEVESCFLSPGGPGTLPRVVSSERLTVSSGPRKIVGLVSPHAGYMYSGSVAANAYQRLASDGLPDVVVLIGPNHNSYYPPAALSNDDAWHTPLGDVPLDQALINDIGAAGAVIDSAAHMAEHSLEVQLPFLQYIYGEWGMGDGQRSMGDGQRSNGQMVKWSDGQEQSEKALRIVPILIGASGWKEVGGVVEFTRRLGAVIAESLKGRDAVIVASTDFTHYESAASAEAKDSRAISAILDLDEEALLGTVAAMNISMCGVLPTAITIAACKKCGAASASELAYRTSGDVTGDYTEVVGYAALEIDK